MALGYGAKISIGRTPTGGGAVVFTKLAEIKDFDIPLMGVADEHETTNHDSPDGFKTYEPGLRDMGELSFPMNFRPDSPTDLLLEDLGKKQEIVQIKVESKGKADGYLYVGFLKSVELSNPVNGIMECTVTFRLNNRVY